jgi:hypothetical protein
MGSVYGKKQQIKKNVLPEGKVEDIRIQSEIIPPKPIRCLSQETGVS